MGSNMVAGRHGSAVHNAKLTETQVVEIRRRYTGKRGQQEALAREFGISDNYAWAIINRVTWTHI
jgi:capsular polysaccharide biosynthesis protein